MCLPKNSKNLNLFYIFQRKNKIMPLLLTVRCVYNRGQYPLWITLCNGPGLRFFHKTRYLPCEVVPAGIKSCYHLLDVPFDSNLTEVRNSYINLAKKYHPDSKTPSANAEKFHQLQDAYKTIETHLKSSKPADQKEVAEDYTEEELRTYTSDYLPLQHRQFINFGGVGKGSPGQRERQYQKYKVSRAAENVTNHRVAKHVSKYEKSLTTKNNIISRKNKSTNAIERLVEDLVQESMARGDFDNLPGKGKPLPKRLDHCPHLDTQTLTLNRVLANNGYVPEFMSKEREIKCQLADLRKQLFVERCKIGPEPLNTHNEQKWQSLQNIFREDIKMTNKKIDSYNLVVPVPLIRLQMVHIDVEKELSRFDDEYRKYEKENFHDSSNSELAETSQPNFLVEVMKKLSDRIFKNMI